MKSRLVGALAESWEYSKDAKSIVFKLRKGIKFHDGSDWNADVAVWNIMRMKDDPKSGSKDLFTDVEEVKPLDSYTFQVTFAAPNVVFPVTMSEGGSRGRTRMISKAAFDRLGADAFAQTPSGSGPYKLVSWKKDDRMILDHFPGYWQKGDDGKPLPYLDQMVVREISDEPTVTAEMRAGTIHWMFNQLAYSTAVSLERDPALNVYYFKEGASYFMIGCNAKDGPFASHTELRQAVAHAINREEVVKALAPGIGSPAHQFIEPGFIGYDAKLVYTYDPDKAKSVVAKAGYPNGLDVKMLTWNREAWIRRAEVYQQQLAGVGMRCHIDALEGLAWRATTKSNRGYDLALWGEEDRADPDGLSRFMTTKGQGNWMNFDLPGIDRLFREGRGVLDPTKRSEYYKRAADLFFESAYVIPIYKETSPFVRRREMHWQKRQYMYHSIATWWLSS
jgi:ABC-type transport system substrate-binding protein